MTNIRRYSLDDRPLFMTVVCHNRKPVLAEDEEKMRLIEVLRETKKETGFRMLAYVLLDDHFHWLVHPASSTDFSRLVQSVKLRFTHRYKASHGISGNLVIWQRRFWDHIIRDQNDFHRHLDYIHYNPVKHGYTQRPDDYPWSSFPAHVAKGHYPHDWPDACSPPNSASLELE